MTMGMEMSDVDCVDFAEELVSAPLSLISTIQSDAFRPKTSRLILGPQAIRFASAVAEAHHSTVLRDVSRDVDTST